MNSRGSYSSGGECIIQKSLLALFGGFNAVLNAQILKNVRWDLAGQNHSHKKPNYTSCGKQKVKP